MHILAPFLVVAGLVGRKLLKRGQFALKNAQEGRNVVALATVSLLRQFELTKIMCSL